MLDAWHVQDWQACLGAVARHGETLSPAMLKQSEAFWMHDMSGKLDRLLSLGWQSVCEVLLAYQQAGHMPSRQLLAAIEARVWLLLPLLPPLTQLPASASAAALVTSPLTQ